MFSKGLGHLTNLLVDKCYMYYQMLTKASDKGMPNPTTDESEIIEPNK